MVVRTNVLSLFSGAGGLELGLKLAMPSARTVCYVEREAYAAANLVARMEDGTLDHAPVWDDVTTFDGKPWRGVVDIVTGGFPCQDISTAGKRAGILKGERSGLWFDMARIIRDVGPEWVFVENVDALVSDGLDIVLWTLAEMGFDAEWGVLGAADAGAPHDRYRTFILGHASRIGRREGRAESELWCGRNTFAVAGNALGHTDDQRLEGRRLSKLGSTNEWAAGATGAAVADAESIGRSLEPFVDDARRALVGTVVGANSRAVVGTDSARVPLRGGTDAAGSIDLPGFPPGPDDMQSWSRVPEVLEPAVCRVAYGLANRIDRLRLAGNGVVPVVAAMAFLALRERFR